MSRLPVHSGGDEVSAHPRHTGHNWLDLILALSAIFISAVSLFVAIHHGKIQEELVAANSWPFVQASMNNGFGSERNISIGVVNSGIGPAKVSSVRLILDGHTVVSPADLLQRCCGLPADPVMAGRVIPKGTSHGLVDNTVLRAGDEVQMIIVRREGADPAFIKKLEAAMLRLKFRGCYCSALDECWEGDLRNIKPHEVHECPTPATPYRFNDLTITPPPAAAPPRS